MSQITSHNYQGKNDFQIIVDLSARVRPLEHRNDYPLKVDIEEALASAVVRANTRLWFEDGHPIGWAFVDKFNNLVWELDPRYTDQAGSEMVAWGEACIRKRYPGRHTRSMDANCREDNAERISFLEMHGFTRLNDTTVRMARPLSDPIPEPELPQGFIIRPIAGKSEAEAVAAMHRAAFGTGYMTTENRLIVMGTSEYDPSLDLVAVAPDGRIAANCICSANHRENIGFTDPVSTHPQFQRMGLSRALLLTGLKLLKERGMAVAYLGTSGNNLAMQKTAESVAFRIEYTTIWFSKDVN
ncbi:MAG: GNAT family N-acetyltransferase [Bacteroidota bacterium]